MCDRCDVGFYGYPYCVGAYSQLNVVFCDQTKPVDILYRPLFSDSECGCRDPGSQVNDCDEFGQCICKVNFASRMCDRCAPGYYKYPDCEGEDVL